MDIGLHVLLFLARRKIMGAGASLPAGVLATTLEALPAPQQEELRRLQTSSEGDLKALLARVTPKDIGLLRQLRLSPKTARLIGPVFETVLILLQRQVVPAAAEHVSTEVTYQSPTTGEVVKGKQTALRLQDSWDNARRMMSEIGFLASLKAVDGSQVNEETVELLYPYLAMAEFHGDDQRKVMGAIGSLCDWVRALVAQKASGVDALIANARARAAAAAAAAAPRPLPPRPIHPVAHLLLLGSVCESSSLVRLRGQTDELRMSAHTQGLEPVWRLAKTSLALTGPAYDPPLRGKSLSAYSVIGT